jgi:hypothetical protein
VLPVALLDEKLEKFNRPQEGGLGRPFFMSYDWCQSLDNRPYIIEIKVIDAGNVSRDDSRKKYQ